MTTSTLDIQRRLLALHFDPGPLDGMPGRRTTAAVRRFQIQWGLKADGLVGSQTLKALNDAAHLAPALSDDVLPPWVESIRPLIGLQERRDGKKLRDYLSRDGESIGDPALTPWCADLVQTAFALTLPDEPLPSNPFWALNWASWGVAVPAGLAPMGAVGVKPRRDSKGKLVGGHVFPIVGQDADHVHAMGGNQNNSVCIAPILKSSLVGPPRWPATYPLPTQSLPLTSIEETIARIEGIAASGLVVLQSEA